MRDFSVPGSAAPPWVKANIAAFDGDPNKIVVFGGSVRVPAVGLLIASPLAMNHYSCFAEVSSYLY